MPNPGTVRSRLTGFENDDLASRADRLAVLLHDLGNSSEPASQRLEAIDTCREFASRLIDDLDRRLVGLSLPIPKDKARLSRRCAETCRLLAMRYKEIASVFARNGPTGDTGNLCRSCFQSIACLGEYLVVNCESYQRVEPGVWLEIHGLYEMAAAEGVEQVPLDSRGSEPSQTVEHAYKRVLLLGLSGVFQHPFRDLSQLYVKLDDWASLTRLTSESIATRRCLFLVDPSLDRPAIPMLSRSVLRPELNEKWLDTLELVNRLKKEYDETISQSISDLNVSTRRKEHLCSAAFLRRMIFLLGIHPVRSARRQKIFKECELVVGLRSLCTALNGFKPLLDDDSESGTAIVSMVKGTFGQQRLKAANKLTILNGWEVEDESLSGMRLACRDATNAGISIGDLVGIRIHSSSEWTIGIVNWATCTDSGGLFLGIRKISAHVRPVLVSRMEAGQPLDTTHTPGLLLSDESGGKRIRSLICHRDLYLPGGTYLARLSQSNGEVILQATNMLLTTRSFVWYEGVKPRATTKKVTLDLIYPR